MIIELDINILLKINIESFRYKYFSYNEKQNSLM